MSDPDDRTVGPGRDGRILLAVAVALVAAVLLLPWQRNHTLLRDFYDYGLVMAAAGRIELGERPYVDFFTPIQTLHFRLAVWAEQIGGARYLSLTYANAVFIVAALVGCFALLVRPLGRMTALLVAAAVVAASAGQHLIVWHNALGVAWLAAVVWSVAQIANGRRGLTLWLVAGAALWLGGMTKLTYQAAALAFAAVYLVLAGVRQRLGWLRVVAGLAGVAGFGAVLPVWTELRYTGATLRLWLENVVLLPQSRLEMLRPITSAKFYFHTPHNYYEPASFDYVGAWGVGVIAMVAAVAAVVLARRRLAWKSETLALGVAGVGAIASGIVLLATNNEISFLAGAASLVLATGLALAAVPGADGRAPVALRGVLAVAALSLLGPAWLAGWRGVRALWGTGETNREKFVEAGALPARFGYLRGLRIAPGLRDSLEGLDDYVAHAGVRPEAFYFVNGAEWMVRAVPEARHAGLPLWLHRETTYTAATVWRITDRLAHGAEVGAVVSMDNWNTWFHAVDRLLRERYRDHRIGPIVHVYTLLPKEREVAVIDPGYLATATGSNVFAGDLTGSGSRLSVRPAAAGAFLGSSGPHRLTLRVGPETLAGEMVVQRFDTAQKTPLSVRFRVRPSSDGHGSDRWTEEEIVMAPDQREAMRPFRVVGGGRPVELEVDLPAGARAEAGWRRLRLTAGPAADGPVPTALVQPHQEFRDNWLPGLFASPPWPTEAVAAYGPDVHKETGERGGELFSHAPSELWFKPAGAARRLTGEYGLRSGAWTNEGALSGVGVSVVFYKAGRFEVLDRRELRPKTREADRQAQAFEVELPEAGGWVGLLTSTLDSEENTWGHAWWRRLELK